MSDTTPPCTTCAAEDANRLHRAGKTQEDIERLNRLHPLPPATHVSTATEDGKDDGAPFYLCEKHMTLAIIAGWRPRPINPPVDPASDWS